MPNRSSKGRLDLNQLAKSIVNKATDETPEQQEQPEKNPAAVALGHIAGHPGNEPVVAYLNSEEKVNETDNSKNGDSQGTKEKAGRKTSSS